MSAQAVNTLRRYAGYATELDELRTRVAELEELLGLNEEIPPQIPMRKSARKLLLLLLKKEFVSKAAAEIVLMPDADRRHRKNTDVYIFFIREWLRPLGLDVRTSWGEGWFITDADKAKIRAIIDEARK